MQSKILRKMVKLVILHCVDSSPPEIGYLALASSTFKKSDITFFLRFLYRFGFNVF